MSGGPRGGGGGGGRDCTVAKTAGILAFSGTALSIHKTLIPSKKEQIEVTQNNDKFTNPTQSIEESKPPSQNHPIVVVQESIKEELGSSDRTVEIAKGDTLWVFRGNSGVCIDAIKEANGLEWDTIYAGKKLVIPSSLQ
ncbi:hypothetical protein Scep_011697 [Stephania cephalantha]|uniref:LysM domain-containing protein n=1 Tax=Stephania cephalantha TaxID=152367 RepID=A0AAP0JDU8_9MAGN